jgi:hypothetical protein
VQLEPGSDSRRWQGSARILKIGGLNVRFAPKADIRGGCPRSRPRISRALKLAATETTSQGPRGGIGEQIGEHRSLSLPDL